MCLWLSLGYSMADSIEPLFTSKVVDEGDDVTLSCKYKSSVTVNYLHWYRQYPTSKPEFLLYVTPSGDLSLHQERMNQVLLTAEFEICTVDSSITTDQTIISSVEGSNITLTCTYDQSADYLHWYRQKPQSGPEFLLLIYKSTDTRTKHELDPRLSIKSRKNENKVDLEIFPAAVSDSALYYCAMQPTVTQNSNRLYKKSSAVDSSITPDQNIISSSERSNITLTCTYDQSALHLHWYRQKPQSGPEFLLIIYESTDSDTRTNNKLDPRLSIKLRKKEK
ncbi:M1-specific T cell receptor beta chain-like [Tachysurus fulvidraco]|uniref:M1-specific T cell receptor beta chain-like n=1 Tax=Tachysurus fulvidraco TaxID=1234273 RepID=UPI001FEEC5A1|nr:M1-specific T cell receptor beta chain-like [Tachysurus fulvidraco]